jgi:UPF0716 family protein affecting phage T7 exclusion
VAIWLFSRRLSGIRQWRPGYFQALTAERDAARGTMEMYIALQPLVALIAGILILMIPRLLNYIVAIYLIVTGILGLVRM